MYSEEKQALAAELTLKQPAVLAVSGAHNSGKTTLLEKLIPILRRRGLKVGVIKHDGHDFIPDVPGTDSFRLREAGAEGVAVYSSQRYLLTEAFRLTEQDLLALRTCWPCSSATAMTWCCWKAINPAAGPRSRWCGKRCPRRPFPSIRWPLWGTFRAQISAWRRQTPWPTGSAPRCRPCKEKVRL